MLAEEDLASVSPDGLNSARFFCLSAFKEEFSTSFVQVLVEEDPRIIFSVWQFAARAKHLPLLPVA